MYAMHAPDMNADIDLYSCTRVLEYFDIREDFLHACMKRALKPTKELA